MKDKIMAWVIGFLFLMSVITALWAYDNWGPIVIK